MWAKKEIIMPLTLTLTEGVLPRGSEKQAVEQITVAMLGTTRPHR